MILFRNGELLTESLSVERKIVLDGGCRENLCLIALGGGDAVFDIDIVGPGASVDMKGLYICTGDDRLNVKVNLRHSHGQSVSNQLFRGVVTDRARADFDGRIVVCHDAQQTEAYQTNQNLQLSDTSTVRTQPQLEIYADDVKCSHGATVGSLNEDEQFYMRSRGISQKEARRLQMLSFLAPVMEELPDQVRDMVFSKLAGL